MQQPYSGACSCVLLLRRLKGAQRQRGAAGHVSRQALAALQEVRVRRRRHHTQCCDVQLLVDTHNLQLQPCGSAVDVHLAVHSRARGCLRSCQVVRGGDGVALRDANDTHAVDAPVVPILQRQREHAPLRVLKRLHGNDAPDACAQAALPFTQAAQLVTKLGLYTYSPGENNKNKHCAYELENRKDVHDRCPNLPTLRSVGGSLVSF